jgi:stage V sporulation protein SpoVS
MRRLIAASALSLVLAAGAAEAQSVDAAAVDAAVQAVTPQVTA